MKELVLQNIIDQNHVSENPVISLYLSKEVSLHESRTLEERWKQLLFEAEFLLLKKFSRNYVNEYLGQFWTLNISHYFDSLDVGLAVFFSGDRFEGSAAYVRLQNHIDDKVTVSDRFHLKPLMKIKNKSKGFFIVTMTSRAINVLIENKGHLVKIDSYRNEPGIEKRSKKDHHEFFLNASLELNKLFKAYRLPIILAGVKTHLGKMRKLLNESMLLEKSIIGNMEKMKEIELQKRVYQICD